jgi:hypothetical protein
MRRFAAAIAIALATASVLLAVSGVSLRTTFLPNLSPNGFGVTDDGNILYENGVQGVKNFFGSGGGNVVLITYSTGRKLTFKFNPASASWQASGLGQNLKAEVDLFGVNFYGPFQTMAVGTTAQVQTSIQFKPTGVGQTYELSYLALAAKRQSQNTWLITSDPQDIGGFPGFLASDQAALGVFRKRSRQTFGAVNMPIRFEVQLK